MYYTTIVALGMFFISPLLSLPFILWDVYKQHKSGLVLFVLFLAVMAYLTPPVGDLYRHTRDYFRMEYYSLEAFEHTLKDDFLVQSFAYFLSSCHIRYPVARFIYTIIGYYITFWIFLDIVKFKYSNKQYFILFLLVVFSSGFFNFVLGVRNVFASKFYLLGFYLLYEKKNILGLLPLLIAPCIHFSFLALDMVLVVLFFLKIQISNKVFMTLGVLLFSVGLLLSTYLVTHFYETQAGYLSGQWGTNYTASTNGMIYHYIGRIWWIPMFYFFARNKVAYDSWNNVIYVLILLFLMTCNLATISGRLLISSNSILVFYVIKNNMICSRRLWQLIVYSICFIFICSIYDNRKFFLNSNISVYSELWKPLPVVLQHDFDKKWVFSHIRADGDIKNKYK